VKPSDLRPQLAKPPTATSIRPAEAVKSPDWQVERKWDGMRALFHILPDRTLIFSRTGQDLCPQFPELCSLHEEIPPPAILDGEIVALTEEGVESLELLQLRAGDKQARRKDEIPVSPVFFDVLAAKVGNGDEFDGGDRPHSERLGILRYLLAGTRYSTPEILTAGDIPAHWEGVICKRADAPYRPGKRTSDWLKYKFTHSATLRATGLTPGKGSRAGHFGAVTVEDAAGVHRGQVGSGFSDAQIAEIEGWGEWWEGPREDWPLIEVEYRLLSKTGLLINTAYKGRRLDKTEPDDLAAVTTSSIPTTNKKESVMSKSKGGSTETAPKKSTPKKSKSKLTPLLEDGSDKELAEFLLANLTYSDKTWASRAGRSSRRKGESRSEFIERVLLKGGSDS
jgi:bifunctional non-homologous end joining protein LigD